jgi:BlaI family transcriptional regulator, penicillinase repressor
MHILLTDREADIMQVLWRHGGATVAEVQEALADELAYTTVLSMLRTLEQKAFVTHVEEGRTHRYFPAIEQHAARSSALQHLRTKLFEGSTELLLTQLVADQRLTQKQLNKLRDLLDAKSKRATT